MTGRRDADDDREGGRQPGPGSAPRRGASARLKVWLCAGLLTSLVLAVGAGFAWVDHQGARTIAVLHAQLDPALGSVHTLAVAVRSSETQYLGFVVTRNPACLRGSRQEAAHAADQLTALHRDAAALPVLSGTLPTVDAQMRQWLLLAHPADETAAAATPSTEQAQVTNRLMASDSLLTATGTLSAALNTQRNTTWSSSYHDRGVAFVFVEGFAAVLVVLLAILALLLSRRLMNPLADLEQRLRQAAEGTPVGLDRLRRYGWLSGLSAESERLRQRLVAYQGDSRRDREALVQNGPTALGLGKLLTNTGSAGPGVRAHGIVIAAEGTIAGDFVDTVALPDGTTALIQGDISGHGVPAGLLAAQVKSAVLSALRLGHGPQAAVQAAWTVLVNEDERFVTLAIAVLDPFGQSVSWVNAGHEQPFLRRSNGVVERLAATGPLVSSVITPDESSWELCLAPFKVGDLLVMTTDGLTEARTRAGTQLEDGTVEQILSTMASGNPQDAVRGVYAAVERRDIDWQRDDVTVIAAALHDRP